MSEVDKQDKTFEPTPQRLQKAREEGNLLRARELVSTGSLGAAVAMMALGTPLLFATLQQIMAQVFLGATTTALTESSVPAIFSGLGVKVLLVLVPFFLILMITGTGLSMAQSGWNLTLKPLIPKGNRISPLKGLKRIFSKKSLFELFKSLVKIAVVGPIAYVFISDRLDEIVMLHTLPVQEIITVASGWIIVLLAQMLICLAVLAGIDFFFERWHHNEQLKMSRQEVKQEMKEQEGSPELRSKRRQLAREMSRRPRLDHAVLKSDVIITNPTHYAVGLRYDPGESGAPTVTVKGIRLRALRIKSLAAEHGIPTVEDRPLARALYKLVPEQHEIPEDLYAAVATILAEIYRKKGKHNRN